MASLDPRSMALVGAGRAGNVVAAALTRAGWRVVAVAGRGPGTDPVTRTARRFGARPAGIADAVAGVALVIVATPDHEVAAVANTLAPAVDPASVTVHLAGSMGLEPLAPLAARGLRVGAMHPLMTFAGPDDDPEVLRGAGAAVAGDQGVAALAAGIGLEPFSVPDEQRAAYHAAASIASNHLVGLLAQVATVTEVPLPAFLPLIRATVANVERRGPAGALTGPVSRGDVETVARHLAAMPQAERDAYRALATRVAVLAGRTDEFAQVLGCE